jgi:hypothetical protein
MRLCAGPAPRAFNAPRAASAFSTISVARWPRRAFILARRREETALRRFDWLYRSD